MPRDELMRESAELAAKACESGGESSTLVLATLSLAAATRAQAEAGRDVWKWTPDRNLVEMRTGRVIRATEPKAINGEFRQYIYLGSVAVDLVSGDRAKTEAEMIRLARLTGRVVGEEPRDHSFSESELWQAVTLAYDQGYKKAPVDLVSIKEELARRKAEEANDHD